MTGLFIILPAVIVGFIIGRKWERITARVSRMFSKKKTED